MIKLHEALEDPNSKKIYLVLEYASKGPILSKTFWKKSKKSSNYSEKELKKKRLSYEKVRKFFWQMCKGLNYCKAFAAKD